MNINQEIKEVKVAMRQIKADIAINNVDVVDVFTSELLKGYSVAICGNKIVGLDNKPYDGIKVIDGKGKTLIPGLVEPHIHIESSYLCPSEFIKLMLLNGTTTAIVDCHEIANTNGVDGIKYFLKFTNGLFNLKIWLPSCVPASHWEKSFQVLGAKEIGKFLNHKHVVGLGEVMDFFAVVNGNKDMLEKTKLFNDANKLIDGHIVKMPNNEFNAYLSQRISSNHECTDPDEIMELVKRGMHINLRYGDLSKNLPQLIKLVNKDNINSFSLCADDINAYILSKEGHLNRAYHAIKDVVKDISKIDLIKMMTINGAKVNNLRYIGAIAPGYQADVVIIDNLDDFNILTTICQGKLVYDGKNFFNLEFNHIKSLPAIFKHSNFKSSDFKVDFVSKIDAAIAFSGRRVGKKGKVVVVNDQNYALSNNPKFSLIDRYSKTKAKNFTCYLDNFPMTQGAFAQTINHDAHSTLVVGKNDEDMALAVNTIKNQGGGFCSVLNGKVIDSFTLEIAGLMTNMDYEEFNNKWSSFFKNTSLLFDDKNLNPLLALRFSGLSVSPEWKITLDGILDVEKNVIVKPNYKMKK